MEAVGGSSGGHPGVDVTRVGGGIQGLGGGFGSSHPALSQDGQYVAFEADFTNLVAGDTNNVADIFVYDNFSKTHHPGEHSGRDRDSEPRGTATAPNLPITPDGRYVAFNSTANNLIATPSDTNLASDVYVRDTILHLGNPRRCG